MGLHEGHRQRMYEKAEKGALAEHEWLELLLFGALPRKNTNEIAHRLIAYFGSANKVFFAPVEELKKVPGVGLSVAAQIRAIGYFFEKYQEGKELKFYGEFTSTAFLPYVKEAYKDLLFEVVDVYLLDGEGYVLKKRRFSMASTSAVDILPEEMSAYLLTEDASGAVIVHNHPFGEARPSEADDAMTKNCQMLCSINNRLICDHFIYAPNGIYSYYLSGKLPEMSKKYSISNVLG